MKKYELRKSLHRWQIVRIFCIGCLFLGAFVAARAQSINQNAPTPITSNEISGRIAARDLGDARLTSYFYTFEGNQGDVFINVVTTNLNGDIDVFTADNLRPLTKITVYADSSNNETGRVVYLRQPAKLILRIEGRTPNDDAATFQVKFAGSFAASTAVVAENTNAPEVKSNNETDVRVNSVGTIIEIKPKPAPTPKTTIAKVEKKPKEKKSETVAEVKPETDKSAVETVAEKTNAQEIAAPEKAAEAELKPETTTETAAGNKSETAPEMEIKKEEKREDKIAEVQTPAVVKGEVAEKEAEVTEKVEPKAKTEAENSATVESNKPDEETVAVKEPKTGKKSASVKPLPPSALENIRLIILFKNGSKIERAMSDVLRVGVDKGILTVISKDGSIGRYSILEVERMTIE